MFLVSIKDNRIIPMETITERVTHTTSLNKKRKKRNRLKYIKDRKEEEKKT